MSHGVHDGLVVTTTLPSLRSPTTIHAMERGDRRGELAEDGEDLGVVDAALAPLSLAETLDVRGALEHAHRETDHAAARVGAEVERSDDARGSPRGYARSFASRDGVGVVKIFTARSPLR